MERRVNVFLLLDVEPLGGADFGDGLWDGPRYAVVCHFLSISHNQRVRLRVFAADEDFPFQRFRKFRGHGGEIPRKALINH